MTMSRKSALENLQCYLADAGKTTLTEKLLFLGAIQEAGAVKAIRLKNCHFDFMEMKAAVYPLQLQ